MTIQYKKTNDRQPTRSAAITPLLDPVLGAWHNTETRTGEFVRIDLLKRDGVLFLKAYGADEGEPIEWGEVEATPFVSEPGSSEVTGLEAHYDFGFMETHIAANVKYGVLVIQSYNRFKDDSGRSSYLTREFFHQDVPRVQRAARAMPSGELAYRTAGDLPAGDNDTAADISLSRYVGTWKNTYRGSKVISHFTLEQREDGYYLHAYGVGSPCDWGEIKVTPHAANVDSRSAVAFYGHYEFGFMDMFLAANDNKGLVIIASYNDFKDGSGRSSYFTRQFFYRA